MRKILARLIRNLLDKYNVLLYEDILNELEEWNERHMKALQPHVTDEKKIAESSESVDYWRGMIQGHNHVKHKIRKLKGKHLM